MRKVNKNRRKDPVQESVLVLPPDGGGKCAAAQISIGSVSTPLPRPARRPRRAKADRGLPADNELANLARAFLARQRMRWPALVEAGLLPEATDAVINAMVEDFKARHRTGKVDPEAIRAFLVVCKKLGGNYNRFSCDNSSPNSALDQMVNALDRAATDERFIPWAYVFADYSVTGLDASRQGYSSYKKVLADKEHAIETTYIDDFTRASRDEIEWWKLAALSKRLNKRMIGASDGFDLNSADWEVRVALYSLISRLFIKSLREKVKRGMSGAARRGTCLGKLSLGFTRRARLDESGNPLLGPDGLPIYEPCVDPTTSSARLLAFRLYVEQKWSAAKTARHFSELKIDGWDGWTNATIKKLLWSATAIGIFVWNKFRQEYDWDLEKMVKVKNPRSQWQVYYKRELAIVPLELWRAARRRLAETRRNSPLTGRKVSRNQISAKTLFSGTLFCDYCGSEIKLIRSTDNYKQFGCLNGHSGSHGCQLSASKSTRIVEECLLGFLRDTCFNEATMNKLVSRANEFLREEAAKPLVDVAPLKAKVRQKTAKQKRLVGLIEDMVDKAACKAYHSRVAELQKELDDLQIEIRDANARNQRKKRKPLELRKVEDYLANLRAIFQEEIPAAAEAIRMLTGKIAIRQEPLAGYKRRFRWIAKFSPDWVQILRHVLNDCPESILTEIQARLGRETFEVPLEKTPDYERLAPEFLRLEQGGASIQAIASAHKIGWQYAKEILHFAKTGERPKWRAGKRTGTGGAPEKYREISAEVVRLRDEEKVAFERIAEELGVGVNTVTRAYDHGRPDVAREAAQQGKSPWRGAYSHLGEEVFRRVRKLLKAGGKPKDVAEKAGCSASTVRRVQKQMAADADNGQAA